AHSLDPGRTPTRRAARPAAARGARRPQHGRGGDGRRPLAGDPPQDRDGPGPDPRVLHRGRAGRGARAVAGRPAPAVPAGAAARRLTPGRPAHPVTAGKLPVARTSHVWCCLTELSAPVLAGVGDAGGTPPGPRPG